MTQARDTDLSHQMHAHCGCRFFFPPKPSSPHNVTSGSELLNAQAQRLQPMRTFAQVQHRSTTVLLQIDILHRSFSLTCFGWRKPPPADTFCMTCCTICSWAHADTQWYSVSQRRPLIECQNRTRHNRLKARGTEGRIAAQASSSPAAVK